MADRRACMGCGDVNGHGSVGVHFACLENALAGARAREANAVADRDQRQRRDAEKIAKLTEEVHAERRSRGFLLRELAPGR